MQCQHEIEHVKGCSSCMTQGSRCAAHAVTMLGPPTATLAFRRPSGRHGGMHVGAMHGASCPGPYARRAAPHHYTRNDSSTRQAEVESLFGCRVMVPGPGAGSVIARGR